ncbi:MAG TPA: ATP-binding protein [Propionibacteriaceae bacterium]|nr:ATP-binding protein [Propionibacteriaceae bacterium]
MLKASPLRRDVVVCFVGVVLCLLFAALIAITPHASVRAYITVVFLLAFGVVAASTGFWRVGQSQGRRRQAWLSFSTGLAIAVVVNATGVLIALKVLPAALSSAFNPMLMLGLVLGVIGLALFPPSQPRGIELARLILDALVVAGSALLIASTTIFPTLLTGQDHTPLVGQGEILALPVVDVMNATMATLLIARSGRSSRAPLLLVGFASLLYSVSDMAYAVNLSLGGYGLGTWWNLGWLGGYVLVSMAALNPGAGAPPQEQRSGAASVRSTIIFFAIFLAAAATTLLRSAFLGLTQPMRIIWGALILTVVIRQIVLVMDNEQLRRALEMRVEERTKEVREMTHQRALLVSSVADGIYGVDRRGRITMVNDAATRLLRRSAVDLIGENAHDLFHAPQDDGTPYPFDGCYITEATTSGLTASGEEDVYLRGDGRAIVVEATASPLRDDNGSITGAVVVFRDVSQRREMDRMKREFISVISHELRTPLTSIRGALGLIAGGAFGDVPTPMTKMIDIATAGSVRLGLLVNDILEIDRLDTGTLPVSIAPCDMAAACQEAIDATGGLAQAAGIELRSGAVSGLVLADRDRLVQVLINLIGNAVRFSDPGDSVVVEASQEDGLVTVAVIDTGRGIPADRLDDIFGRFSQVDSSDARERGGTGLGLAICRGLVEAMGGRIWAESSLGVGSTFQFELPAANAPTPMPTPDELPAGVGAVASQRAQEG